jgi:hypothetical protein
VIPHLLPVGILRLDGTVAECGEAIGDGLCLGGGAEVEDEQVVAARGDAGATVNVRRELQVVFRTRQAEITSLWPW